MVSYSKTAMVPSERSSAGNAVQLHGDRGEQPPASAGARENAENQRIVAIAVAVAASSRVTIFRDEITGPPRPIEVENQDPGEDTEEDVETQEMITAAVARAAENVLARNEILHDTAEDTEEDVEAQETIVAAVARAAARLTGTSSASTIAQNESSPRDKIDSTHDSGEDTEEDVETRELIAAAVARAAYHQIKRKHCQSSDSNHSHDEPFPLPPSPPPPLPEEIYTGSPHKVVMGNCKQHIEKHQPEQRSISSTKTPKATSKRLPVATRSASGSSSESSSEDESSSSEDTNARTTTVLPDPKAPEVKKTGYPFPSYLSKIIAALDPKANFLQHLSPAKYTKCRNIAVGSCTLYNPS